MSKLYPCVYCTEDGYCKKYSDDEVTSWCVQSPCKDEKPSNADRIRNMTDEELAEFLSDVAMEGSWKFSGSGIMTKHELVGGELIGWLDWLKQECEL